MAGRCRATWPIAAIALVASGCGAAGERQDTPVPAPTVAATPPALTPLTEAEIRRTVSGCLQHPPYALDGGPQCLRADGTWILYSGWGNPTGRYRIAGNRVILTPEPGTVGPRGTTVIAFLRRKDGTIALRYEDGGGDPRLQPYRPYSEADYLSYNAVAPPAR